MNINKQERNGDDVPVEVEGPKSAEGHNAKYRFMLADVVNQQLKDVKMRDTRLGR